MQCPRCKNNVEFIQMRKEIELNGKKQMALVLECDQCGFPVKVQPIIPAPKPAEKPMLEVKKENLKKEVIKKEIATWIGYEIIEDNTISQIKLPKDCIDFLKTNVTVDVPEYSDITMNFEKELEKYLGYKIIRDDKVNLIKLPSKFIEYLNKKFLLPKFNLEKKLPGLTDGRLKLLKKDTQFTNGDHFLGVDECIKKPIEEKSKKEKWLPKVIKKIFSKKELKTLKDLEYGVNEHEGKKIIRQEAVNHIKVLLKENPSIDFSKIIIIPSRLLDYIYNDSEESIKVTKVIAIIAYIKWFFNIEKLE